MTHAGYVTTRRKRDLANRKPLRCNTSRSATQAQWGGSVPLVSMNNAHSLVTLARLRSRLRTGEARAIREAVGVSYAEAARAARVSPESVRRWEAGLSVPHAAAGLRYARTLETLADALEPPAVAS